MNNLDPFIKLDPYIELLTSYFEKFKPSLYTDITLNGLLNVFVKEPTQDRVFDAVKEIVSQRDGLIKKIDIINEYNVFHEVENIYDILIPLKICNFNNELEETIIKIVRGSGERKKIFLCPYCFYLFYGTVSEPREYIEPPIKPSINIREPDDHSSLKVWDYD